MSDEDETCEQRNLRMRWGCRCHGVTFCPDLRFSHYDDDVPVFANQRKRPQKTEEDLK